MVSISASAPGKLVLLGEYAVLEGGVALVAAVGVRSRVTVKTWRGESCILDAPGIGIDHVVFECHGDGVRWPPGLADEVRARLGLVDAVLTHFLKGHDAELLLRGGLHFQFRVIIYILALIGKVGREVMIFMRLSGMGPNGLT